MGKQWRIKRPQAGPTPLGALIYSLCLQQYPVLPTRPVTRANSRLKQPMYSRKCFNPGQTLCAQVGICGGGPVSMRRQQLPRLMPSAASLLEQG